MAKLRIPRNYKEKELHRSIYDLSQNKVLTMMQGLNIPVKFEIMKPKDKFTVDYRSMIDSMPMVGRQLNDWKLRVMLFKSNLSNYYSWMDNNAKLEDSEKFHHTISPVNAFRDADEFLLNVWQPMIPELTEVGAGVLSSTIFQYNITALSSIVPGDTVGSQSTLYQHYDDFIDFGVQPGSLLDMLEFPVSFVVSNGASDGGYKFNADYLLCYLDAVRNYLVNNQLDSVPYFAVLPNIRVSETGHFEKVADEVTDSKTHPYIGSLQLKTLDKFFKLLRMQDNGVDIGDFIKPNNLASTYPDMFFTYEESIELARYFACLKFGGIFLAQYERDMLNGLLSKVADENVYIQTDEDGNFSINQFRFANRKQLIKDRWSVAGGRWKNLLRTIWGVDNHSKMDIPEIVNVSSYYLSAKSVMSTSNTEDGEKGSALGQLAGVFKSDDLNEKKIPIYTEDHCIMFAIVSLVPDVLYCNGLGKGLDIISFDDEYYPQLDGLGFEDVPRYKYNALPHIDPTTGYTDNNVIADYNKVVGKNIAFIDLISNINRAHGYFTKDAYFETWVLKREFNADMTNYEVYDGIEDNYPTPASNITTYVNPLDYQYPFTVQSETDHNFVFQIGFDIRAVRSKGKYFMPTLGR